MKSFVLSSKCIGDVMSPSLSLHLLYILLWLTGNIAGSWPVLRCQTAGWKHLVLGSLGCFHLRNLFTQVWCDYPAALVYCFYAQVTRTARTLRFHLSLRVCVCVALYSSTAVLIKCHLCNHFFGTIWTHHFIRTICPVRATFSIYLPYL